MAARGGGGMIVNFQDIVVQLKREKRELMTLRPDDQAKSQTHQPYW